jgi:hypothetical protein
VTRILLNFLLIAVIVLLANCKNVNNPDLHVSAAKQHSINSPVVSKENEDSINLTNLVRKVYKWHETNGKLPDGFNPQKKNLSDTMYSSIDLNENNDAIRTLKETGFFTTDFLNDYRKIAVRMDKELRNGTSTWREGEYSSFTNDANE